MEYTTKVRATKGAYQPRQRHKRIGPKPTFIFNNGAFSNQEEIKEKRAIYDAHVSNEIENYKMSEDKYYKESRQKNDLTQSDNLHSWKHDENMNQVVNPTGYKEQPGLEYFPDVLPSPETSSTGFNIFSCIKQRYSDLKNAKRKMKSGISFPTEQVFVQSPAAKFLNRMKGDPYTEEQNYLLRQEIERMKADLREKRSKYEENVKLLKTARDEQDQTYQEFQQWVTKLSHLTKEAYNSKNEVLKKEKKAIANYNRIMQPLLEENGNLKNRIKELEHLLEEEDREIIKLKCQGCDQHPETFMAKFKETDEQWENTQQELMALEEEEKESRRVMFKINAGIADVCRCLKELNQYAIDNLHGEQKEAAIEAAKVNTYPYNLQLMNNASYSEDDDDDDENSFGGNHENSFGDDDENSFGDDDENPFSLPLFSPDVNNNV